MTLRDLEYVVAVADHRNFGTAAEKCFVSQPALSIQIRKFEDEIGIRIFERRSKGALVTSAGSEIIRRSKIILFETSELMECAKCIQDPYAGELRIGVFPTLGPYLLPEVIPQITERFPKPGIISSRRQDQ